MGKLIDLTGQRFGRLTVIERAENAQCGNVKWRCICDCGLEVSVQSSGLRSGQTVSCGCFCREKTREANTTHGKHKSRIYSVWSTMKQRCINPKAGHFERYGGRGIAVCEEWQNDFQAFYDWAVENGYREGLSIDRIDNDKGYSPYNCRWVTQKKQRNNTSANRKIMINGVEKNLCQWCEEYSMPYSLVHTRLKRGWLPEEALGLIPRNK